MSLGREEIGEGNENGKIRKHYVLLVLPAVPITQFLILLPIPEHTPRDGQVGHRIQYWFDRVVSQYPVVTGPLQNNILLGTELGPKRLRGDHLPVLVRFWVDYQSNAFFLVK